MQVVKLPLQQLVISIVAFVDGAKNITDATGFLDIVIANAYTKPA